MSSKLTKAKDRTRHAVAKKLKLPSFFLAFSLPDTLSDKLTFGWWRIIPQSSSYWAPSILPDQRLGRSSITVPLFSGRLL